MSNTVITNYTDLNGPSTKADSSVVVIVNKDGSLSVDQNLLGTLMGNDGSQGAGISVVRVGHEGRPDDATDSESEDDKVPHVTLSVDSYYDEPSSIIKYDSGAEMLQSLRIETRENSLVGFHNDHCYTPLTSPSQGQPQRNDSFSGYDEPVIEITHTPPPKPVPQTKKITILEQKIIPKGKKIILNPTEASFILKGNDVLNKSLPVLTKAKEISDLDKSYDTTETSSISSGESIPDRDSDSDYKDTKDRSGSLKVKKGKLKPRILKNVQTTKTIKSEPKVISRLAKAGKNIFRREIRDKGLHKNVLEKKPFDADFPQTKESLLVPTDNSLTAAGNELNKVVSKQTPKPVRKERKTPAHVTALLSDMTSLFSTPDVIRRVSTDGKLPMKPEKEPQPLNKKAGNISKLQEIGDAKLEIPKLLDVTDKPKNIISHKTYLKQKEKTSPTDKVTKGYDIPQLDDASLAQILQDTAGISPNSAKVQPIIATGTTINSPGLAGPLSPTLDLLGGLQPEEEGLTEDLLMHVAQLVESSENLQEVIDKQVLGKVDAESGKTSVQSPFQQAQTPGNVYAQTPSRTVKSIIPQKSPIEVVRRDGRVITLPPIEAPATRSSKRKSQLEPSSADVITMPTSAPIHVVATTPEPQVQQVSKQYINKKLTSRKQEPVSQSTTVDKISAESQESWNSEDDPYRLWCICKQPHNNRFMICCDACEDWFHGKCVNITKAMGQQMEEQGIEWRCPNCIKKTKATPKTFKQITPTQKRVEAETSIHVLQSSVTKDLASKTSCIVCKRPARASSIYCTDACILKHAQDSLCNQNSSTKPESESGKPQDKQKSESRVIVYERKSGRLLAGPNAPTAENLKTWLQKNPTFEVVRPGTLSTIKPNIAKRKSLNEPNKIQTTLNFERMPRKSAEQPLVKTPQPEPREKMSKFLQLSREEVKITPQPKTPVTPRSQPPQFHQDTPRPSTSTARTMGEPKKPVRATMSRSQSAYDKAPSVSPSTSRRKEAPDIKKRMDSTEPIRDNVRKALQEQMGLRMAETTGPKFTEYEIQQFAVDTECELYELFSRDVGMKYKAKYRSLMFNIKDRKNLSLWRKICDGTITPKQLVRLSPEELASQELAQWRDKEAKYQLELIKKSELDLLAANKTYVLKTHKGEEVMQTKEAVPTELDPNVPVEDVVTALNDSTVGEEVTNEVTPELSSTPSKSESTEKHSGSRKRDRENSTSGHSKKSSRESKRDSESKKSRSSRRKSDVKDSEERSTRRSDKKSRRARSLSKEPPKVESTKVESTKVESTKVESTKDPPEPSERSRQRSRSRAKSKRRSKSREHSRSTSQGRERSRSRGPPRRRSSSKDTVKRRRSTRSKTSSTEEKAKNRSRSQENVSGKSKNDSTDSESIERPKSALLKEVHPEYDPHEPMITSAFSEEDLRKSGGESYEDSYKHEIENFDDPEYDPTNAFSIDTSVILPTPKYVPKQDKTSEAESDQEPSSTVDNSAVTVWNGCINMVDVARFYVAAHEVSGSASDLEEDLSTELDIVGRINPDTVWDYISKMKRASNKDIVILRLHAANDEEKMQYIALYSYLSSRNRLGVVKVANTATVKDFYIVPLPANTALPAVLLPLDGPGLGEIKTHLLIAIVIRQRKKRPAPNIPKDIIPAKVARESRKRSYTPPIVGKSSYTPPTSPKRRNALPLPSYTSPALSTSVKDKIAASLAAADDEEAYSPGSSSSGGSAPAPATVPAPDGTPAPPPAGTPAPAATKLRCKMEELNRQIEDQKQQIFKMAQADSSIGEVLNRIINVDLQEQRAVYHTHCYAKFCHPYRAAGLKRGRTQSSENTEAMNLIYSYLETNSDDRQFSLHDIRNALPEVELPSDQVIKYNLRKRYGADIIITSGNPSVICLLTNCTHVIQSSWYEARQQNDIAEKQRIVEAAGRIILEEVTSRVYETDYYPAPTNFLKNAKRDCPPMLLRLLQIIIMDNKLKKETYETKCVALAHGILSAARPRSFRSPLLLGLSSLIHHKYASKYLIDLLSEMGFCATYDETLKLQVAAIATYAPKPTSPSFTQFVFDNADVNVHTLDGNNTFHTMGGIQCLNPPQTQTIADDIPRLKYIPKSFLKRFDQISMQTYIKPAHPGLDKILFSPSINDDDSFELSKWDLLWMYGKSERFPDMPGWNTFMIMTQKENVQKEQLCEIKPLPFINAPASSYDTILTALKHATEISKQCGTDCIVTFDQPLYQKAQEIVKSSEDPQISKVILRLGGFHLLMSYTGAVGKIMAGSGLKELWATIFAVGSLEKMITGHHYERSVRAHSLSCLALFQIVINNADISLNEKIELESSLYRILGGGENETNTDVDVLESVADKFVTSLKELEERGPTAKLWVSYFKMTLLIQNFIKAERTGDWALHLNSVKEMLPYLHAAGHFHYSKSASLYLQEMENLETVMTPDCYEKFVTGKMFTVRRTQKSCSGTWTDMTIEQSLMRSMKVSGGLTQGRGFSDNVLSRWVLGLPFLHSISEEVENFCDATLQVQSHKDGSSSRISRDAKDLECLLQWFEEHNPFPKTSDIMSISTGVVGNDKINSQDALRIGKKMMNARKGTSFGQIKYSRKETVEPLSNINSAIYIKDKKVPIEPDLIFKRISFLKKSQEELKTYLQYELSPYPLSLFDKNGLRKTNKSSFYEMFSPLTTDQPCEEVNEKNTAHVIDGGLLLHRVVWQKGMRYSEICEKYVNYVNKFVNPTVVFDGYENENCVKTHERIRRARGKINTCVLFQGSNEATMTQEQFLSNDQNKSRLITMLTTHMKSKGITVYQSPDDADTLIIDTAVEIANKQNYTKVVVVGEDIDLLVILTSKKNPYIFMMKPGKGNVASKLYNSDSFKSDPDIVLFAHAFTGCDTTSAIFRHGKRKACSKFTKNADIKQTLKIFNDPHATKNEISKAGEILLCDLYGGMKTDLNALRYDRFALSLTKSSTDLASLPPTSAAATQHSLRVYYQVQKWLSNELNPTDWGWEKQDCSLIPITTTESPAPDEVLKIICCKCKLTCKGTCTCIKAGLKCTALCIYCIEKKCNGDSVIDQVELDTETEVQISTILIDTTDDLIFEHDEHDTTVPNTSNEFFSPRINHHNVDVSSSSSGMSSKRQKLSH